MPKAQIYIINSKMGNGEQLPGIAMKNDDTEQSKNKEERTNPYETDALRQRTEDIYMVKGEDWRRNGKGRGLDAIFGFQQKILAESRFANRVILKA